jgi:hypothetical protein
LDVSQQWALRIARGIHFHRNVDEMECLLVGVRELLDDFLLGLPFGLAGGA